jgi:thioredoxin reductase
MSDSERPRVVVVGAGLAGLTAGLFAARNGFDPVVLNAGEPILQRNSFLENFPGFPAGVDPRLLLEMTREQARRNGCRIEDAEVVRVDAVSAEGTTDGRDEDATAGGRFTVELAADDPLRADSVIAASWADSSYLDHLPIDFLERGHKRFVDTDRRGRTALEGLYAAGRVARQCHQAVVAAGHGASVATAMLEDAEVPFYHDWVAPDAYFTGRGRDLPPGCEEIDGDERRRRERRSRDVMTEYFEEPHPGGPTQHSSVDDDAYDDI